MELKQGLGYDNTAKAVSFNRTFMELKHIKISHVQQYVARFNRTFMELKPLTC